MKTVILLLTTAVAVPATFLMRERVARTFAALAAAAQFLQVLSLAGAGVASSFYMEWLPALGIHLDLRLDGSNLLMLMLAPLLTCAALAFTPAELPRQGEYSGLLLLMLTALEGLFLANNLGLFYFFFEVMLIPAILLTVRYGGHQGRLAALKFLLFTLAGSLPMLLGVLAVGAASEAPDLAFSNIATLGLEQQKWLFVLFAVAFVVKMPLFPFHGWLPDLYRHCPAQVVAVIAGVMSKAGAYGFIKIGLLLFPDGMRQLSEGLTLLGVVTILYGGFCALGADSLRGALAYSSLSHMGMIAVGISAVNATGLAGANLQMFAHGISTGGLFLVVAMLSNRGLPDELRRLGGMAQVSPRLAAIFLFLVMASLGLPGLCGFPGEVMILMGLYAGSFWLTLLASVGILLAGWYLLRLFQKVMHGRRGTVAELGDIQPAEWLALAPFVILAVLVGMNPDTWSEPFTIWMEFLRYQL